MKGEKNILVLDLETQKSLKEVGKGGLHKLRISVAGTYDYLTGEYLTYEEKDLFRLENRLQSVNLLIGFNIAGFDLPVLAPYLFMPVEKIPVLDLLETIREARGHRVSLDSLAGPTLGQRKSGTGIDALALFKENRMEELKRYCLDDVRLTREIYEYGCREGKVLFTSAMDYKTYSIPVDWKEVTEKKLVSSPGAQDFPTSLF